VNSIRLYAIAGSYLAAVLVGGCGQSSPAKKQASRDHPLTAAQIVCQPSSRDAVAQFLSVQPANVGLAKSVGNNTMPQCAFTAQPPAKKRVTLLVNYNTGAQPYFVLERTAIEAGQVFTQDRMIAAPVAITGLGIEADWFPAENQLMATDGLKLITVTVTWHGSKLARQRALAEALTRTYLKQRTSKSLAKGYPSG
jgi:hypothetical protein